MADDLNIPDPPWNGDNSETVIRMVDPIHAASRVRAQTAVARQMYRHLLAWPPDDLEYLTSLEVCYYAADLLVYRNLTHGYVLLENRTGVLQAFAGAARPFLNKLGPDQLRRHESFVKQARDSMINAQRHQGGMIGRFGDEMAVGDLQVTGLVTPKMRLTARGAELADVMRRRYFIDGFSGYGV